MLLQEVFETSFCMFVHRIELDDLGVVASSLGWFSIFFVELSNPQEIFDTCWSEFEDFLESHDRALEIVLIVVDLDEGDIVSWVVFLEGDGFVDQDLGGVELSLVEVDLSDLPDGFVVLWIFVDDPLEDAHRLDVIASLKVEITEHDHQIHIVGVDSESFDQFLFVQSESASLLVTDSSTFDRFEFFEVFFAEEFVSDALGRLVCWSCVLWLLEFRVLCLEEFIDVVHLFGDFFMWTRRDDDRCFLIFFLGSRLWLFFSRSFFSLIRCLN